MLTQKRSQSDMSFREQRIANDPIRSEEVDVLLKGSPDKVWEQVYRLLSRAKNAEKRAKDRERMLEAGERLKAKMFDLMHVQKVERLDCCTGLCGVSTLTGEEVRFHDPACHLRSLDKAEVESISRLAKNLAQDKLEDIADDEVEAVCKLAAALRKKKPTNEEEGS